MTTVGSLGHMASEGTWDFRQAATNLGSAPVTAWFSFTDNKWESAGSAVELPADGASECALAGGEIEQMLAPNAQWRWRATVPTRLRRCGVGGRWGPAAP